MVGYNYSLPLYSQILNDRCLELNSNMSKPSIDF